MSVIVAILGGAFFLGIGYARPRFRQPCLRRGLTADLTHAVVNGALLDIPLSWLVRHLDDAFLPTTGWNVAGSALWQQAVIVVLGGDLLKWTTHRLQHAVPILWRLHRIHHSSEQLDSLSHARSHPLEFLVNRIPFVLLFTVALGIDLRLIAAFSLLDLVQGLWAHSNTHVSTPWLNKVLATQEFHHWHHATDRQAIDKNFGGFLSVWDWIFGTAYCPVDRHVSGFGISGPPTGDGYFDHLLLPIRRHKPEASR